MHRSLALGSIALVLAASCGTTPADPDSGTHPDVSASNDASDDTPTDPGDDTGDPTDGARDFTVSARGMTSAMGHAMGVWVMDTAERQVLGYGLVAQVTDADFDVRMPSLVPEGDYTAEAWVDANDNGTYDGPTTDPSWRVAIPGTGSATVIVNATDATTDIAQPPRMANGDFAFHMSGLSSDEANQRMELRVIDPGTGATVGAYAVAHLPAGATYSVALPGILQPGSQYNVDFWIDMNGDGVYSGPGIDRTWRTTVLSGATGGSADWTQDDNYIELDWR